MRGTPRARRDVIATMVGFARTLRAAGVDASPHRVQAMLDALDHVDVLDRWDVYWAGRLTLCGSPDDIARYDRGFHAYFSGEQAPPLRRKQRVEVIRTVALPAPDTGAREGDSGEGGVRASTASDVEVLRHRDVSRLSAADRAELRRLLALLDPVGPVRRSRRFRPAHRGPLDVDRTVRATLRRGGEPALLLRQSHRDRPRRLVLLVDVSGSMTPYADALLRFAHVAARRRPGTEVFTIGTRLTRVTREMRSRDPEQAMTGVAEAVPDWSGGTRLGELVKAFLDRFGQRGVARGAVVVVASDGWERGDAALLGEQMARLRRLAHRVVWVNPHKGQPGYAPLTAGMAAALPSVDDFVAGHSLAALENLCSVLSRGGRRA
ncbi:MAG: vWA domain-containing protein [Carbonactinosporaceae bacterium]